jgi:hypothetical protein
MTSLTDYLDLCWRGQIYCDAQPDPLETRRRPSPARTDDIWFRVGNYRVIFELPRNITPPTIATATATSPIASGHRAAATARFPPTKLQKANCGDSRKRLQRAANCLRDVGREPGPRSRCQTFRRVAVTATAFVWSDRVGMMLSSATLRTSCRRTRSVV